MLGVGWTEMLLIGVVALIVIGPKELPALMHRVGKFAGTIRRMGQDFQRELNKTTGLNEIRNLRESVAQPLKATADAIRKEFNTTTASGEVKPSGVLKPADPKVESVVDEIKAAAGMTKPAPLPLTPAAAAAAAAAAASPAPSEAAAAKAPVKAARPARIKAPAESKVEVAEIAPAKKATKPKAAKPIESPAPVEAIAPARKPATRKPASAKSPEAVAKAAPAPRKTAAKKPAAKTPAAKKTST
jgi:sec-independent protein translocase protein TatB